MVHDVNAVWVIAGFAFFVVWCAAGLTTAFYAIVAKRRENEQKKKQKILDDLGANITLLEKKFEEEKYARAIRDRLKKRRLIKEALQDADIVMDDDVSDRWAEREIKEILDEQ